jgi:hypothetical protein
MREHEQGLFDGPGAFDKVMAMIRPFVGPNGYITKEKFPEVVASVRANEKNLGNEKGSGNIDDSPGNPECPYFADGIREIWSPEEMQGNAELVSKQEDFDRMDKFPMDGKVSIEECRRVIENDTKFTKMQTYGQSEDTGAPRVNEEQFCEYHMAEGEIVSKEVCSTIFMIKDVDGAGSLNPEQAVSGPAEDIQREKDRNPGCTPVRRLQEVMVNEPRRRKRALKMMKRELRGRMRARRNLQAHHANHEEHYGKWVERRRMAAEEQVEKKNRRLKEEKRRLQASKQRVLSITSADNNPNSVVRKLFGSDKFFNRIQAEIVDMPIREDYQAMDDDTLKSEHRRLT